MRKSSRRPLRELRRREHRVAAVRRDERVRDGADAPAAPPRRLRVGGDADLRAEHGSCDVRGVAVARLDAVVVVPRGHEDDRLAVRRLDDASRVRRDQRTAGERPEDDRLEVGERRVVALDRHHGLPRLEAVAVAERVDGQAGPVVRAELEDRERLVHAAEHRLLALEDLHDDPRMAAVVEQRGAGVVEVRVAVVAVSHLLDREVEDRRVETRPRGRRVGVTVTPCPARRASTACRAASATSSCSGLGSLVESRRWSSVPGRASARERRLSRVPAHPAEDLDGGADRADRADQPRGRPVARRDQLGGSAGEHGGERERADEV